MHSALLQCAGGLCVFWHVVVCAHDHMIRIRSGSQYLRTSADPSPCALYSLHQSSYSQDPCAAFMSAQIPHPPMLSPPLDCFLALLHIRTLCMLPSTQQGMNPVNQKEIDDKMRELDGTPNKGKLGANAILAVSMAVCKVQSACNSQACMQSRMDTWIHCVLDTCWCM